MQLRAETHMDPINASNAPDTPLESSPVTAVHHSLVAASGEQCPSCGNPVAPDQRYCLHCGQRCGEPRLPFMNAVTFMDAMKRPVAAPPSPPKTKRRSISPNAALITGVGTLLLAMGVGVLIGRSGNNTAAAPQQAAAPIVIKGGGTETSTASTAGSSGKSSAKGSKSSKKSEATAKAASSGKGAEEVLKPAGDVKLPPATVQPGEKCEDGAAGCKGGEFTGEFFGE